MPDGVGDELEAEIPRELVDAAQSGDAAAWEKLYCIFYPRLRGYVARRVDSLVVEDVVSDIVLRAVAGIEGFRWEPPGFGGWLFGIARRACADHHRGRWRRARRSVGQSHWAAEIGPGDALELADDHAEIRRLFELLSTQEREVLELRVVAGLSAEQAARVLGKRAGAVRTAQSRALAHLRLLLDDAHDG